MNVKMFVAVLLGLGLFGSAALAAGLCGTDTLANYEALGAAGCTVKGLPFSSFVFTTVFATGGAVPVTAGQITVSTVDPDISAGLNFASSGFSVSAGQSVEYDISYVVDDPPIIHGWDLTLSDPVNFPAFINITSEECLGAAFIGTVCPTATTVLNTVSDNGIVAVLDDTEFFPFSSVVGELTTIRLDASAGGSASFNSFSESAIITPEPWSLLLTGISLVLLVFARRRLLKTGEVAFDFGVFGPRA